MLCRPVILVLTLAVAAATARPAVAWNDTGHKVVGLIAYQALDDGTKKKVLEIFKAHPHYEEFLAKGVPDGVELGEWVAMKAATWPDWVKSGPRSRTKFSRPTWHYVNRPYIVVATTTRRAGTRSRPVQRRRNHGHIVGPSEG